MRPLSTPAGVTPLMNTSITPRGPEHIVSTVLIADDDPRVRQAVRALLETAPHLSVAGEACTSSEVLDYDRALHPDIVLLDLVLPRVEDGLDVLGVLTKTGARRVIAMSLRGELRADALAAGACAFVEKGLSPEVLLAAITAACDG